MVFAEFNVVTAVSIQVCPQVAHLRESFTCYGIDLRGYGDSPTGIGPDILYFGSDVAHVVSTLGLQGRHDLAAGL